MHIAKSSGKEGIQEKIERLTRAHLHKTNPRATPR